MSADKPHRSANHTLTARTGMPSLLGSLAQLPSPRRLTINKYVPQYKPSKFTAGRRELRSTFGNSFHQSVEKHHRSCIRTFWEANHDVMNSPSESPRRVRKDGLYKRTSTFQINESFVHPLYRSVQDIGVDRNRKGRGQMTIRQSNLPNPISKGRAAPAEKEKKHYRNEQRKYRDDGERCARTFHWTANRTKTSYAQIHKNRVGAK